MKRTVVTKKVSKKPFTFKTDLCIGDSVMVLAGGNKAKGRVLKGQVGTLKKIFPKTGRVTVEGLNMVSRHKRASTSQEESAIVRKESPVDISNVMFYSEKLKRPVRLKVRHEDDGTRVRGYINPETKSFEAV